MSKDCIRMLLVEDSPSDARLLCESLENYPLQRFEIEHAERLEEALALLARRAFDVILQDLNLPDSSGMETCRQITRAAGHVPVIVLTGADDETSSAEAMCLGVQDYLVKGQTSSGVIGRTIRYAVERSESQRALRQANERLQEQAEELQVQSEELQAQAAELRATNGMLVQREHEYRTLAENTPEVIARFDRRLRHTYVNEYGARVYGVPQKEVIGRTIAELGVPADKVAFWNERFGQVFATGRQQIVDFEFDSPTFGHQYFSSFFVPEFDADGQVASVLAITRDVTAARQAEEAMRDLTATLESRVAQRTTELKHRAKQLQKLTLEMSEAEDRERDRLAHILHDDLQQELAAAKFHLSIVRSRIKYDSSLQEITATVDEMLKDAIAKSRSLSHELSPAVLHQDDFREVLRWLADEVQAKHGLTVRVHGQAHCQSDPIKAFLYRTAQELLFNTVKHAQVDEARVRVRPCGGYICLAVSDRGRGFDPGRLREATGLGLLSIRERIELIGGRMTIRSAPGKGSTFFVVVPNGEVDELEPAGRARSEEANRLRVLLVDDHEIVREGLASLLGDESSVEVIGGASNGREAVDLADRLKPDVVIMDVAMPIMTGDEATRQIKQNLPNTRVVALSMSEDPDSAERMRAAGAEAYLLKTAPSEELLAAIRGD